MWLVDGQHTYVCISIEALCLLTTISADSLYLFEMQYSVSYLSLICLTQKHLPSSIKCATAEAVSAEGTLFTTESDHPVS